VDLSRNSHDIVMLSHTSQFDLIIILRPSCADRLLIRRNVVMSKVLGEEYGHVDLKKKMERHIVDILYASLFLNK